MVSRTPVQLPLEHKLEGELPYIMALDPGGTTGWAWLDPNLDYILCGQIGGEHHVDLVTHINSLFVSQLQNGTFRNSIIVCESFQFRQFTGFDKSKVELHSVEYIGVLKYWSQLWEVPLVLQTASTAKNFVSDEKLRRLDWYKPTAGGPHGRDALRHLLYYLVVTLKVREPFVRKWLYHSLDKGDHNV